MKLVSITLRAEKDVTFHNTVCLRGFCGLSGRLRKVLGRKMKWRFLKI